jgi:hypothetical protein
MVIALNELIEVRFRPQDLLTRRNFYVVLPMVVIFCIWFAYPPKLFTTWGGMVNQPRGVEDPYSLEGLLFYPRALLEVSGSVWIFILLLVSLVSAATSWHDRRIRFLFLFALTLLLIGEVHHTKGPRHLFPMLPALFLLAGQTVADLWSRVGHGGGVGRRALGFALVGALGAHAVYIAGVNLRPPRTHRETGVVDHVEAEARKAGAALIIGTKELDRPNIPTLDWRLLTEKHLIQAPQAGIFSSVAEIQRLEALLARIRAPDWVYERLQPLLGRIDQPGSSRTMYLGLYPHELDEQAEFDAVFRDALDASDYDGVIVLSSRDRDAEHPLSLMEPSLETAGLDRVSVREFDKIRVDAYRRSR